MSAPPPPPHGESPRSSGLPPGKYDIFVIPQHSAGSGFLYLPSLQPSANSFAAGFASALILVALFQSMAPAFRVWWDGFQGLGNMGITLLIFGVGFGAWALGRTQKDAPAPAPAPDHGHSSSSSGGGQGGFGGASTSEPPPNASGPPPPPHGNAPPPPPSPGGGAPPPPQQEKPKPSWQRSPPQPGATRAETPKGSWEKAREETRKKEEERKAKEAEQKRREEAAKRLAELRAKEARERLQREKEKEAKEKEAKEKEAKEQKERDLAEKRKKDAAEKLEREKREREAKEREAKEREAKERQAKEREEQKKKETMPTNRVGSSYAYSSVGEKTSMWPNGRPAVPPSDAGSASKSPESPDKRPPPPTARTCVTDEEGFSSRPYDKPRKPRRRPSVTSMGDSESSWAPSHTTAQTSPPPSVRGPYSTKDPDKIVIQAVYLFMNQFAKTPASQLISGVGSVTDGLILRITTEGLFIDDDVRGVPQREWDVKAWTLKLVETGEWKAKGLHVLRATVRDQEGKRYMFVLDETESWKVAVGLQRLRRGTQVRQLGVSGMTPSEARGTLEMLGWSG